MSVYAWVSEVQVQAPLPDGVHQGRWGFHPCDRETFLEIKELHRYAYHDRKATRRHERWAAKLPHNRRGPEPKALGTSAKEYGWIFSGYYAARHPAPTPGTVSRVEPPLGWRGRLEKYRAAHGELKK